LGRIHEFDQSTSNSAAMKVATCGTVFDVVSDYARGRQVGHVVEGVRVLLTAFYAAFRQRLSTVFARASMLDYFYASGRDERSKAAGALG